jgi:hypothetical protein
MQRDRHGVELEVTPGSCGKQCARIGMGRFAEDTSGWSGLNNLPQIHDSYLVGQLLDDG